MSSPRSPGQPPPGDASSGAPPPPPANFPSPPPASFPGPPMPSLPERHVTALTIEDAYVRFIFYCNPALSLSADTDSLREAFRNPPRSGGKCFHPFTIFELVRRFYAKEIRTWTELTTMLGVEPPDPSKDESAQKIAQYGVRLKKWMNSMHVRAFFEYLMDMPNDYWTKIPTGPNPIAQPVRDGVAVEDDMALRALIPHIRPKRGRKRPDGEEPTGYPPQRVRLSPSAAADDGEYRQGLQPWSAHPEVRVPIAADSSATPRSGPGWAHGDTAQTPLSRWPQSAATPTSRGTFWDDALEPRSAVTPSRPRPPSYRRGAKNVSSAWKPGGLDSGAKQRGRPPLNRTAVDGPGGPAMHSWKLSHDANAGEATAARSPRQADHGQDYYRRASQAQVNGQATPTSAAAAQRHHQPHEHGPRPSRPSISLQVPERQGGPVRQVTPPQPQPAAVNGQRYADDQQSVPQTYQNPGDEWQRYAKEAADAYEQASKMTGNGCGDAESMPEYYFEKMEDRTNVDALVSFFVRSMADSDWVDVDGNPDEPATVEEATALVNAMLQNLYKTAASPQSFLINLAALAGSTSLVTTRPKCSRMGENDESYVYKCDWEYRFGHLRGSFTMPQHVPRTMWKKPKEKQKGGGDEGKDEGQGDRGSDSGSRGRGASGDDEAEERPQQTPLTADDWKRKYQALAEEVGKRNRELSDLRNRVMGCLGREWTEG